MKIALLVKKTAAMAAAVSFIVNICSFRAFAQTASVAGRSASIGTVYAESKSVKDSFVLKEDSAGKENSAGTSAVNNKAMSAMLAVEITGTYKKIVLKDTEEKKAKYDAVVNELTQQSGLSKDVIEKAFDKLDKSQLDAAVNLLSEMFKNNGSIVSCGLYALGSALNIPAGEAAFLALITDIKIGAFRKECLDSNFVYGVSGEAQIEVLRAFGFEKAGIYTMPFGNFLQSLKNGESAILYLKLTVEGEGTFGHVVTVKKEVDSRTGKVQYALYDNDKKSVYGEDEFISILRGQKSVTGGRDGNKKVTYNAVGSDGRISFLPAVNRILAAPNTNAMFAKANAAIQNLIKSVIALIRK